MRRCALSSASSFVFDFPNMHPIFSRSPGILSAKQRINKSHTPAANFGLNMTVFQVAEGGRRPQRLIESSQVPLSHIRPFDALRGFTGSPVTP